MKIINALPLIVIVVISHFQAQSQILDFDSLYQHNPAFKEAILSRPDAEDLFKSDEIMKVSIVSDFKNMIKHKYEGKYQPATLRYFLNDTVAVTRQITVKPRGNMRRKICYFPPLMLNFPRQEAVLKQIQEFDKIKMVMDCKRSKTYEQYLLSEYYAYKLYNLITDYSFRVRLIELTYVDSNDKLKTLTSYAYIIENLEQMAQRLNAISLETKSIRDQYTDLTNLGNCYLFQYLIGNTDWSIPALHNIKIIKSKDPTRESPFAIPYDFDYAGIVNADYAVPDERLGITTVRERVYRGVCIDNSYIKSAAENFKNSRDDIYNLYNTSLLDDRARNSAIDYIDQFFQDIENDKSLQRNILDQCR